MGVDSEAAASMSDCRHAKWNAGMDQLPASAERQAAEGVARQWLLPRHTPGHNKLCAFRKTIDMRVFDGGPDMAHRSRVT